MLYLTYTRQTATTQLSNQSLVTGISPSDWKMAEVSPIFKNGSKSDLELSAKGGNFIYPMMLRTKFLSSLRGGKSVRGFRGRFSTT